MGPLVTVFMEVFVLLLLAAGCAVLAIKQSDKIKTLNARLRPIEDVDKYVTNARMRADVKLNESIEEAKGILAGALQRRRDLAEEIKELKLLLESWNIAKSINSFVVTNFK